MRTRRLYFVIDKANDAAWISGYGSRELIVAGGGRPMWNQYRHAWHSSAKRAPDLLALADLQGIETELREVA